MRSSGTDQSAGEGGTANASMETDLRSFRGVVAKKFTYFAAVKTYCLGGLPHLISYLCEKIAPGSIRKVERALIRWKEFQMFVRIGERNK